MNTEHNEAELATLNQQYVAVSVDLFNGVRIVTTGPLKLLEGPGGADKDGNLKFSVTQSNPQNPFYTSILFSSKDITFMSDPHKEDNSGCKKYIYIKGKPHQGFPSFVANES